MARSKKNRSIILDRAQARATGLQAIDANLDFGNGLTADAFRQLIHVTREALMTYNSTLSKVDYEYNIFLALERALADMTDRMLTGVAAQYGKNSNEYEMAGGKRKPVGRRSRQGDA